MLARYADDERLIDAPGFTIIHKRIDMHELNAAFDQGKAAEEPRAHGVPARPARRAAART